MRLYIAGPMTGIPQFNFPAFDAMAARLRSANYTPVSPAELDSPSDRAAALASPDGSMLSYGKGSKKTWGDFLARDVKLITDGGIEGVVVLKGWQASRGARLETFVANGIHGLPVYTLGAYGLNPVPRLDLFRAWTAEPTLSIFAYYTAVTA